jgi:hypothetical protein
VTLKNTATNATRQQDTGVAGSYTFPNVAPGTYALTVERSGFQTATVSDLRMDVNKSYTVDIPLTVGATSQTVVVSTEAMVELQTTDATIGNVIGGNELVNLPTISRGALELLTLQTGAMPSAAQGDRNGISGGSVSGARGDQNAIILDGLDVTNMFNSGEPDAVTIIPMNVDAIEEFRVGVTNPNALAASAAGGQVTVATKGGSNAFHGDVYYYIQNTAFNANSWDNNAVGNARPVIRDNRGGFSFGGPIKKDKTFFFMNYEPRRFATTFGGASNEIVIPSDTLRQGILYVGDTAYNLQPGNISNTCGPNGNTSCDPRGLGISPVVSAMWNLMPHGNDFSTRDNLGSVTHPNLVGYIFNAPATIREDTASFRLDHNFSQKVHFFGRYGWTRGLNNLPNQQVDLRGSTNGIAKLIGDVATRGEGAVAGLDWTIRSNLVNSFHFGWLRQRVDNRTVNEAGVSELLKLPGTQDAAGDYVAVQPGYLGAPNAQNLIGQPIAPPGTNGVSHGKNIQFEDDLNWIKGNHAFVFGGDVRWLPVYLTTDVAQGAVSSIRAIPDLVAVSNSDLPGGGAISTVPHFYGSMLGLVNKVDYLESLDASFKPLPGHNLGGLETHSHAVYFFFQDTWRVKPSLTLTYGLAYGWQTPYTEKLGRGMVLVDASTNKPIDGRKFLDAKKAAALQGVNYNPTIGYEPYQKLGLSGMWNTDWSDISPRASVAWSPSADSGFQGKLLGVNKTVIRAGYALVYDRLSGGLISHVLGVPGFYQSPTSLTPACDSSGTAGAGCNASSSDPAISTFRVGVDGNVPVPPLITPSGTLPFVPDVNQGGVVNDPIDPNFKQGRNHMFDFSIQRELPKNMIMEVGYIGRLGRRLPSRFALNAMPYMFKDVTTFSGGAGSGQSFAQAFDNVAQILRYSAPGTPIPIQPWFEDQLPSSIIANNLVNDDGTPGPCAGGGMTITQCFANLQGGNIVTGNLGNFGPPGVFAAIDKARCPDLNPPPPTPPPSLATLQACSLINRQQIDLQQLQSQDLSFYHALTATLRNRGWRGLVFDINYTWSKSLDQGGRTQGFINGSDDPFNPDAMYGPSYFDRKHVFNMIFNYNLPFGQGHKLGTSSGAINRFIGGWSFSGVFRANSGLPLVATESPFALGGGFVTSNNVDMIPTGAHNFTTGLNHNTGGTAKAGTACANFAAAMGGAGPVTPPTVQNPNPDISVGSGSGAFGFNYFSDPAAAYCSFRPVLLSSDTRDGRGNPLRGFGMWNLDSSIGKETAITERFKVRFSADFFNMFNHLTFVDPLGLPLGPTDFMDAQNASTFGVVSKQFIPANRQSGSRWVQFGLRVSF